jgi:hypothetical protein
MDPRTRYNILAISVETWKWYTSACLKTGPYGILFLALCMVHPSMEKQLLRENSTWTGIDSREKIYTNLLLVYHLWLDNHVKVKDNHNEGFKDRGNYTSHFHCCQIMHKIYLNVSQPWNPCSISYDFHPAWNRVKPQGGKSHRVTVLLAYLSVWAGSTSVIRPLINFQHLVYSPKKLLYPKK